MCIRDRSYIGEVFTGIISHIASFGMFVELDNTIEGLVRLSSMEDDYYRYDEKHYCLIGERMRKTYRIGDMVKVLVIRSSPETRQIDFALTDEK